MTPSLTREQLPSGKMIIREFDKTGALSRETHIYGSLDIAIAFDFRNGAKIDESYFAKGRMVSRNT